MCNLHNKLKITNYLRFCMNCPSLLRKTQRCGTSRCKYCAPAHFVEKPGRVPLALRLVVDCTRLNEQLIRNRPQVFPTWEEIRQQLGSDCKVQVCMDTLAAYFQKKSGRRTAIRRPSFCTPADVFSGKQ